jgi:hypothetical protein
MDGTELAKQPSQFVAASSTAFLGVDTGIGAKMREPETFVFDAKGNLRVTYPGWLERIAFVDDKLALATVNHYKPGGADLDRTELLRIALNKKQSVPVASVDFRVAGLFAHSFDRIFVASPTALYVLDGSSKA